MIPKLLPALMLALGLSTSPSTHSFDLSQTPYGIAGKEKNIDPLLLYSVSLAESAFGSQEKGKIGPHPWTLRSNKAHYEESKEKAEKTLQRYLEAGKRSVDVGLMQVNIRWNGNRVASPYDLLDPLTNVRVAADVLQEAIASAPGDLALGIGRYHHWEEEARARNYGERVLAIYRNLRNHVYGALQ